jgi:chemotaxis protein MotB
MRRRHGEGHENHERWLVSYADFITLLFAFFVVMFASTQADKAKARQVSDSVRQALEHGQFSAVLSTVLGRGRHEASRPPQNGGRAGQPDSPPTAPSDPESPHNPADLARALTTLHDGLNTELESGKIEIRLEGRGLVISLRESAFFASGDDTVAVSSYEILAKIAAVIRGLSQQIRLEGYTDSIPIHNSRFRSNWELSAARSIAMLELLRQRYGFARERMSVAGYAENAPADTNDTEEGRAHNRRVDLVVLSEEAMRSEPHAPTRP